MSGPSNNGNLWRDPAQDNSGSGSVNTVAASINPNNGEESGSGGESGAESSGWIIHPTFNDAGPMVEINVGNGKATKKYLVYKNFATFYSPVFDRAFNGNFIETETQVYNIVDFDFPDAFAMVMRWIHTRSLGDAQSGWGFPEYSVEELSRAWVLGDRLLMPSFQNCAIRQLCYTSFRTKLGDLSYEPLPLITRVYKETGPGTPLRRLLAYKCAYELDWEQGLTSYNLPHELISEIASIYQRDARKCKIQQDTIHDSWGYRQVPCDTKINPNYYYINIRATENEASGRGEVRGV